MASKRFRYIDYVPSPIRKPIRKKGDSQRIFNKLAKRVHADAKKAGKPQSWQQSQKFTSSYIYQEYKNEYISKIDLREVDRIVENVYEELDLLEQESQECGSVFKIPISDYFGMSWFELQTTLPMFPADIYLRVNGGSEFGHTEISLRSDLDYYESGPSAIVEKIRKSVNNESGPTWNGEIKVRPKMKDNGQNCSYFLDLVLDVNGTSVGIDTGEKVTDASYEKMDTEDLINRKIRMSDVKKEIRERQKQRELDRENRDKMKKAKERKRPKQAPKSDDDNSKEKMPEAAQDYAKILELLRKDYDDDLMSVKEYKAARAKIVGKIK